MSATYRFVFDGGTGYTQVEFAILLDAGVDQGLNRSLFLEQQEGVAWREEQTGTLGEKKQIFSDKNYICCMQQSYPCDHDAVLCPLGNSSYTSEYFLQCRHCHNAMTKAHFSM